MTVVTTKRRRAGSLDLRAHRIVGCFVRVGARPHHRVHRSGSQASVGTGRFPPPVSMPCRGLRSAPFIVDDHPAMRAGVAAVLDQEEDIVVVGAATGTRPPA